jgi:parallel beta-helix repeat protein
MNAVHSRQAAYAVVGVFAATLVACDEQADPTAVSHGEPMQVVIAQPDTGTGMAVGDTLSLTAALTGGQDSGSAGAITWASSDTSIAQVIAVATADSPSSRASIRILGGGAALITAEASGARPDTLPVSTVSPELATAATGTTISPGQSIQGAVNAYPGGTTFTLKAGVHRLQSVQPKAGDTFVGETGAIMSGARLLTSFTRSGSYYVASGQTQQGYADGVCAPGSDGCKYPEQLFIDDRLLTRVTSLGQVTAGKWYFDYGADKIYFTDYPTGHRVEIGVLPYAFSGSASNVTIRGLKIEKYASPTQNAAVWGYGSTGWLLESNEIRWNHGAGAITAYKWVVRNNNIHHNGLMGLHPQSNTSGALIEGNNIAYNNTAGFSPHWGAAGIKSILTTSLTVRNNYVHDNAAYGIWCDNCFAGTTYSGNKVANNAYAGIYHEVSAGALITGNTLTGNGVNTSRGGILVDNSANVEITGNTLSGNGDGIKLRQVSRPDLPSRVLTNVWVHDNKSTVTRGSTGILQYVGDNSYFTSRNNRFTRNTYTLIPAAPFAWKGASVNESQWKAAGQDVTGTFIR